jgi:hypothetical protein
VRGVHQANLTPISHLWHIYAMRNLAGLSVLLCLGAFSYSFAADPPPASTAPAESTATPSAPAAAATAATTPPASDNKAAKNGSGMTQQEHVLRTAGYKPRVRNGTTIWCRQETAIGSRLAQQERCGTPEEIERSVQEAKDTVEKLQHTMTEHQSN